MPFAQRFEQVTQFQQDVYLVSLCAAAVATAFLIAPTAFHRMVFRRGQKRHLVFTANKWVIIGLVALAVAMIAAVLLVADFLFETGWRRRRSRLAACTSACGSCSRCCAVCRYARSGSATA